MPTLGSGLLNDGDAIKLRFEEGHAIVVNPKGNIDLFIDPHCLRFDGNQLSLAFKGYSVNPIQCDEYGIFIRGVKYATTHDYKFKNAAPLCCTGEFTDFNEFTTSGLCLPFDPSSGLQISEYGLGISLPRPPIEIIQYQDEYRLSLKFNSNHFKINSSGELELVNP